MARNLKPGETAPVSGLYELIGPRGGRTGKERTVARGEVLPPPPKAGMKYRIAERAHNKSGHDKRYDRNTTEKPGRAGADDS